MGEGGGWQEGVCTNSCKGVVYLLAHEVHRVEACKPCPMHIHVLAKLRESLPYQELK